MCWSIMEAVLSTIVFGYTVKNLDLEALFGYVAVAGYAVWTGVSYYLCTSKAQAAVNNIKAVNGRVTSSLRNDAQVGSLGPDDVDLFEYHDIASMSSNMLQLATVWILTPVCFIPLGFIVLVLGLLTCQEGYFAISSCPVYFAPTMILFSALYLGYFARFLYTLGVVDTIWNLGKPCQIKPFSFLYCSAWTLISVGSIVHTAFMFFSSAPSIWRWGVIVTHTTRASRVMYSLHIAGHGQGRSTPCTPDNNPVLQDKMC